MLIRNAEVDGRLCDVRMAKDKIVAIAARLPADDNETSVDACGGALIPGLHDHHIHLNAAAAAMASVKCGPPEICDATTLAAALHANSGEHWLRGIGYHHSVAGEIGRDWLDRHGPDRPVRIQHRGGRMWYFNSAAIALLGPEAPADGRLLDGDAWLRARLGQHPPDVLPLGRELASLGITGLTEVTPRNGPSDFLRLAKAGLAQRLLIMGTEALDGSGPIHRATVGPVKLHYHDHDLPPLAVLTRRIAKAHEQGRAIAAHCVTRAELFLTLAALEDAGPCGADRIEHAAIAPPEAVDWMAQLGVTVVTQPHFLTERASAYRVDVPPDDQPWLYRLKAFCDAGIPLAAGSDAPFGSHNPWLAMASAIKRPEGFGAGEALTADKALGLFLGQPANPGGPQRRVAVGEIADLCLLDRNGQAAKHDLSLVKVRATFIGGECVFSRP